MRKINTKEENRTPAELSIVSYFHCAKCLNDLPQGMAPTNWVQIEAGWTQSGFQVWCKRCQVNIMHIDFEGHKHPANCAARDPSVATPR